MDGWLNELDELKQRIARGTAQPETTPGALPLGNIVRISEVFQHRSGNLAASEAHVRELGRALQAQAGKPLDPITVYWIGDAWCCIDGHHRLDAYGWFSKYNKTFMVPVRPFSGTLDDAIATALGSNTQDKLVMGRTEKTNGAWRLVIGTGLSKARIARTAGVSERTVSYMRDAARKIKDGGSGHLLGELTWQKARLIAQGLELPEDFNRDDWMEEKAQDLALSFKKHFKDQLGKQPEVFARALEIYDSRLLDNLREWLGNAVEEVEESEEDTCDF